MHISKLNRNYVAIILRKTIRHYSLHYYLQINMKKKEYHKPTTLVVELRQPLAQLPKGSMINIQDYTMHNEVEE